MGRGRIGRNIPQGFFYEHAESGNSGLSPKMVRESLQAVRGRRENSDALGQRRSRGFRAYTLLPKRTGIAVVRHTARVSQEVFRRAPVLDATGVGHLKRLSTRGSWPLYKRERRIRIQTALEQRGASSALVLLACFRYAGARASA